MRRTRAGATTRSTPNTRRGLPGPLVFLIALALLAAASLGVATALADTAPSVTIQSAPTASYTRVHVKGAVNPGGGPSIASWHFEYATAPEGEEGWSQGPGHELSEASSAEATPIEVEDDLTGLAPNTEYFVRLLASNEAGPVHTAEPYPSFTTKEVAVPSLTAPQITALTATTAHFAATVNPGAPEAAPTSAALEEAFRTAWHFECTPTPECPTLKNQQPADEHVAADNSPDPVGADVAGLTPGTEYKVRLVATNAGGESQAAGAEETFITEPTAPGIALLAHTSDLTKTAATLNARVNPDGAETTYRFEWGTSTAYANSVPVPDADIGAVTGDVSVSQSLNGLSPDTLYHYRVLASNSVDTSEGGDHTFRTNAPASEASGQFPGQGFLPDNRAWEMVSPVDKNGGDVNTGVGSIRASENGAAVVYESDVAFADAVGTGSLAVVTYRGDRNGGGWPVHAITPDQKPGWAWVFSTYSPVYNWFSPDLSQALLQSSNPEPALASSAPEDVPNLYLTDGVGANAELVTPSVNPVTPSFYYSPEFGDVSADGKHVAFASEQNLTQDTSDTARKLYEWSASDGVELAGVMPNGSPAPEGARLGAVPSRGQFGGPHAISTDGSRLYFTTPRFDPAAGQLFLRKNSQTTNLVSESEAASPDPTPRPSHFWTASADGSRAFFTTGEQLVGADVNPSTDAVAGGAGTDLYMYTDSVDPEGEDNLTLISRDQEPADGADASVEGVLGASDDGSRVYFAATGRLVSGQPVRDGFNIYVWEEGSVKYIATIAPDTIEARAQDNWSEEPAGRSSRVTADGDYLIFSTTTPQPGGYDNGGHQEIYRYDALTKRTICVSCRPSGSPAVGDTALKLPGGPYVPHDSYASRALLDGGRRVVFTTGDAILSRDVNGKSDVYQWEEEGVGSCADTEGCISLISSGRSDDNSYFADAGATGNDIYFLTRDRLSAWDVDGSVDLYDARVGGGVVEPPVDSLACEGDACQPPPIAVNDPTPGSASFSGVGNQGKHHVLRRRCPKRRHQVKARTRSRCAKQLSTHKRG